MDKVWRRVIYSDWPGWEDHGAQYNLLGGDGSVSKYDDSKVEYGIFSPQDPRIIGVLNYYSSLWSIGAYSEDLMYDYFDYTLGLTLIDIPRIGPYPQEPKFTPANARGQGMPMPWRE